jgi:hypothetical protein
MELFIFARFHVRDGCDVEASAILLDQAKRVGEETGCLASDIFASVRGCSTFIHAGSMKPPLTVTPNCEIPCCL